MMEAVKVNEPNLKDLFNELSYLHSERIKFENTNELKFQQITKQINFIRSELKRCGW